MTDEQQHNNHMTKSPTPKTDTLREVIIGQYKKDELTGDGMGNLLAALTDIEMLGRERSEALEELAKWQRMSIDADNRFVESVLVRDEESKKSRRELDAERALADRLAGALKACSCNAIVIQKLRYGWDGDCGAIRHAGLIEDDCELALAAWKEARGE